MAYATAHADRVRHLILVDSAGPKMTDDVVTLFGQVYPDKGAVLPDWSKKSLEGYLSLLFHSPENRKAWLPQAAKVGFNPLVFEKLSSKPPDLTSEISKLKVTTLILHGRHDMNVAPITGWTLHQAIKDSHVIFFESSGHLPFFEEPELFGRAVGHFITDN
jgi:pimeloyl-ACP methyl ester carboxylesterase